VHQHNKCHDRRETTDRGGGTQIKISYKEKVARIRERRGRKGLGKERKKYKELNNQDNN